jgi:hypothetical protein
LLKERPESLGNFLRRIARKDERKRRQWRMEMRERNEYVNDSLKKAEGYLFLRTTNKPNDSIARKPKSDKPTINVASEKFSIAKISKDVQRKFVLALFSKKWWWKKERSHNSEKF